MEVGLVIRTSVSDKLMVKVRFRLMDGRKEFFHRSEFMVNIKYWDFRRECYKSVMGCPYTEQEKLKVRNDIADRKRVCEDVYLSISDKEELTSQNFHERVVKRLKYGVDTSLNNDLLVSNLQKYLIDKQFSKSREKNIKTIINSIMRFEKYKTHLEKQEVRFFLTDMDVRFLKDYRKFIDTEATIKLKYPELYSKCKLNIQERSINYIDDTLVRLRLFWNWCLKEDLVSFNPFLKFDINQPIYDEPIVLTRDEIDILNNAVVEDTRLDLVKDYFLLCSSIGCRISELNRMTKATNYIEVVENGKRTKNLEFTQIKGLRKRKTKVCIPLNEIASQIVNKYWLSTDRILPVLKTDDYNKELKILFKIVGLNRTFLHMDSRTGRETRIDISDKVSSHMGRRNFISAAVNSGFSKEVYTSMTGHRLNSPHLERYIHVENDIKKNLVDKIYQKIHSHDDQFLQKKMF